MFTAAAVIVSAIVAIDVLWLGVSPIEKRPPAFDRPHLLKMLLSALASALFVSAVLHGGTCATARETGSRARWSAWGVFQWFDGRGTLRFSRTTKELLALAVALGVVGFVYAAFIGPGVADRIAKEDGPIEMASALLLLIASGLFALVAVRLRGAGRSTHRGATVAAVVLAGLLFLIAMEEISWFQRFLGVETPRLFEANEQNEINFHNLFTWESEIVYYFGAFLWIIVAPFLVDHVKFVRHPAVEFIAPSQLVAFAGAMFVSFSFEMWNGIFTQVAFFTTLLILLHYGRGHSRTGGASSTAYVLAAALVVAQIGFLLIGHGFIRSNMLTEYKEFLIPLAFVLHGGEVLRRTSNLHSGELDEA